MAKKIDKNKIRIMSQLAVYDKKGFEKDASANDYFRHDFIYKKNMSMRFHVGAGILILAIFYFLYLLSVREEDIFGLNFQVELVRFLTFAVIVMIAYSFIGTIIFTREFLRSQKRVRAYFKLMSELSGEPLDESLFEPESVSSPRKPVFERFRIRNTNQAAEPAEENDDEYEHSEPYLRDGGRLERTYIRSDDPSFWDDEDKTPRRR